MRKTLMTLAAAALLAGTLSMANAQERRRDRDNDEFGPATAQQLAAADRRLNQVYQRRIADAREDDRRDRRMRGWYSQEQALRTSENHWIAFRDAECRYLTQQDVGSRNRSALVRGCLLELTEDRTEDLREAEQVLAAR